MSNSKKRLFAACKATLIVLSMPSTGAASDPTDICARPTINQEPLEVIKGNDILTKEAFSPSSLEDVYDLDGDGDLDFIVLGAYYQSSGMTWDGEEAEGRIFINDGDLNFHEAAGDRPGTVHPREVLYADFDNNGLTDFFVADHGWDVSPFPGYDNSLMLQFNDGWLNARNRLPPDPNGFTHNAAIGDIDNDGDTDIFVPNQTDGQQYWLINDGNAVFTRDISPMPKSFRDLNGFVNTYGSDWQTSAMHHADDLDGDGFVDLIIGESRQMPDEKKISRIYWGGPSGYQDDSVTELPFSKLDYETIENPHIVTGKSIDVNSDGKIDLLLSGNGEQKNRFMQLWINLGSRKFLNQTEARLGELATTAMGSWHYEYQWFDFNRDGNMDLVPLFFWKDVSTLATEVYAWFGDGKGYFAALTGEAFLEEQARYLGYPYIPSGTDLHSLNASVSRGTEPRKFSVNVATLSDDINITPHGCRPAAEATAVIRFKKLLNLFPKKADKSG